ncbi:MAG: hypothetical protein N2Z62_06055 [Rhodobacteraceae bacterium]|nr:hypothetical protein [Paracoccaceae bacterium]
MPDIPGRPADRYSPLYFLASVGAGGLAVTFFMYLLFWVPHPGQTVPVFEDIARAFAGGGLPLRAAIAIAVAGIAVFGALNLKYLVWNLSAFAAFRHGEAHAALLRSNGEPALLALPLALAMSINVGFILGLVLVPGLWGTVEYLFPAAMTAFGLIGALALAQTGAFLGRILSAPGGFDPEANNSFATLLPAFALAMVAVGLAAPAAMSGTPLTVGAALILSTFFGTAALLHAVVAGITAVGPMLRHGVAREAAPTLTVVIPLMTVLGIMALRQSHGLDTTFAVHATAGETLIFLTRVLAVQLLFAGLALAVLRRQGYVAAFVTGAKISPGAYALVCPGVALSVMVHFWLNKGLVAAGLVERFSAGYWAITLVALALQAATIWLVLHLNRRHFGRRRPEALVPAA